MEINEIIARELSVPLWRVDAAISLLDDGNTVPFIARYRKEATGGLNDEELRKLSERLEYLRNLADKKSQVLKSIEEQGFLTRELKTKILNAETQVAVDDLYRPYRPKRRTRATIAKEKGLEPLAMYILLQRADRHLALLAEKYIDSEKGVETADDALAGAADIIAEIISDNADYRAAIRDMTYKQGVVNSSAKKPQEKSVYENYYDYSEPVIRIAGHRILAINRGEKEKILSVKIIAPEERITAYLERKVITADNVYTKQFLCDTVIDSYKRLIAPAIETEIRNMLTDKAQEGAISVFGKNLEQLLMQPPISGHTVLGWDPAFRTGCKLAVVDATGKVLDTAVIYPTEPTTPEKISKAKTTLARLIEKYDIGLISLGNGTASRESEKIIADFLRETGLKVQYVIVNEAGASVYSASEAGTEEFPDFDVGQRSAASIARRLLDPLAELVKIEPRSIGVGQYQHDMNEKRLDETLHGVVEACVNKVGVDLNTASAALLKYIAGVTPSIAKNIVAYRETKGRFTDRKQLLKVDKLGEKTFGQCAGFLRISGGDCFLDATGVHPESYAAATELMHILGITPDKIGKLSGLKDKLDIKETARKLGIGEPTLADILLELEKPARDPREELPKPVLRSDILDMDDLKEGMILKGTVRNIIDFGVFVDIGVHQDGLVHISQLSERFIKHPLEVVKVGDIIDVKVLGVDKEKKRISLTCKF